MDEFRKIPSSPVSIYALGGLDEVGKNTYCIENEKTLIMIVMKTTSVQSHSYYKQSLFLLFTHQN